MTAHICQNTENQMNMKRCHVVTVSPAAPDVACVMHVRIVAKRRTNKSKRRLEEARRVVYKIGTGSWSGKMLLCYREIAAARGGVISIYLSGCFIKSKYQTGRFGQIFTYRFVFSYMSIAAAGADGRVSDGVEGGGVHHKMKCEETAGKLSNF